MSTRRPTVERGSGDTENDPERAQSTQARSSNPMPSKSEVSVSRGSGDLESDPERVQRTQARSSNPMPSKSEVSVSRGGGDLESDPERVQRTQAKQSNPLQKVPKRKVPRPPTQAEAPVEESYHTGADYAADRSDESDGDDGLGRELNLEGEGLDALEPDALPPKTRHLEALKEPSAAGESDGDEGESGSTTQAGAPIKIEIIGGPDAGKKKRLQGVRCVIGRTPGVDLLLSDQSVSRRHVELVKGDGGVLLRDLGSGNGTKVNGQKVAEQLLKHGDEIAIGQTKMRFVDEVAAFAQLREDKAKKEAEEKAQAEAEAKAEEEAQALAAQEPSSEPGGDATVQGSVSEGAGSRRRPRRTEVGPGGFVAKFMALEPKRRVRLVAAGLGGVIVLLILISVLTPSPPPPPDPRKAQAAEKMQKAREAVRAGNYQEAIDLADQAERLSPGVDTTRLAVTARDELAVQKSLEGVRALLGQQRFDDARTELAKVGQGSLMADEQKKKVEEELKVAEIKALRERVEELVAAGDLETAKQTLALLPDADQRELAISIAQAERAAEEQKKKEELEAKQAALGRASAAKSARAEKIGLAFAVVQRKFAGGEWERSAAECDRVIDQNSGDTEIRTRAKRIQAQIAVFGRNYDEGTKKFRDGQIVLAAKPLKRAREAYLIIDLPNAFGPEVDEKLAQAALAAGKEALLRDDLPLAAQYFREALKLEPDNAKAQTGLDEVVNKAEELYQLAYGQKGLDTGEALKKFRIVVLVTPAGSAIHEKAKNQLSAMQQ